MFFKFSVVLFLSISLPVLAKNAPFGVVTKIRGKVSVLKPGLKKADYLRLGDSLKEDTSILTYKNSFVRIQVSGKSSLNIGPNSKVILKNVTNSQSSLLSLLKGQVRANIKNQKSKLKTNLKHKFLIKTKTAAIGVRGTELHSIHNPENNVTSLISYEGDVKIVKLDDDPLVQVIKEEGLKELDSSKMSQGIMKKIDEELDSVKSETVKNGQFSASVPKETKVSQAVKISPIQLAVLYKNKELIVKEKNIAPPEDRVKKIEEKEFLSQAEQKAPLEGFRDKSTGDYAPRSGGFIDLNSGYYIEPNPESSLDADRLLYVAEKIGRIDKTTGQYKAPMGMKLDSVKGFVIDERVKESLDENQLAIITQTQNKLNKNIISKPVKNKIDLNQLPKWAYSSQELLEKNQLIFSFSPRSHRFKTKKHVGKDPVFDLESDSSHRFDLRWTQPSAKNWLMSVALGFQYLKFKSNQAISDIGPRRYHHLSLGALMYLNETWSILPELLLQQRPFLITTNNASAVDRKIVNVTIPSVSVGLKARHFLMNKWGLETMVRPFLNLPKSFSTMRAETSFGIHASVMGQYWHNFNSHFDFGPFLSKEGGKTAGSSYSYTRSEGGIIFSYALIF
jgi:hypothetical protein